MRTLSVSEARRRLPRLVEEVARTGEDVVITHHGRPTARLVGYEAQTPGTTDDERYPLRGTPIRVAEDFDEPLDDLWDAPSS